MFYFIELQNFGRLKIWKNLLLSNLETLKFCSPAAELVLAFRVVRSSQTPVNISLHYLPTQPAVEMCFDCK